MWWCVLACGSAVPQHTRVDGSWLRQCNASSRLWRGVAVRDLRHAGRPHDRVSTVRTLAFLSVPKVASSSGRDYAHLLNGTQDAGWFDAVRNGATVSFALTRDPIERFLSAAGTVSHRANGDAWDTKGKHLIKGCLSESKKFVKDKKVGRFSYAAASVFARCFLAVTEDVGVFWNHHVAPQLSYYAVLNPNTQLIHGNRFAKHATVKWKCESAPPDAQSRPAACVHQPAPVHAMPMRDGSSSLVQRGWDRAAKLAGFTLQARLPRTPSNRQEGRWRILDYAFLIDKLGIGFATRVCKLFRDDYVCLRLPAPEPCRHLPGFEGHAFFYANLSSYHATSS